MMGVCQASCPQQPCEVGCVVLFYKWGTEASGEEGSNLPGYTHSKKHRSQDPSPSHLGSKTHIFSKKQEIVLPKSKPQVKSSGTVMPAGGMEGREGGGGARR